MHIRPSYQETLSILSGGLLQTLMARQGIHMQTGCGSGGSRTSTCNRIDAAAWKLPKGHMPTEPAHPGPSFDTQKMAKFSQKSEFKNRVLMQRILFCTRGQGLRLSKECSVSRNVPAEL